MASEEYLETIGTIGNVIGDFTGANQAEASAIVASAKAQMAATKAESEKAMYTYGTIAVGLVAAAFLGVIYFSRR